MITYASIQYLDTFSGAKTRHLFFGLMYIFRLEYATMSLMISIYATSSFAAPIGVYGLLRSGLLAFVPLIVLTYL